MDIGNFSIEPKKVIAWIGSFLLISVGAMSFDKFLPGTSSDDESAEIAYVSVPIIVFDSESKPIKGVKVQFISEGAPEPKRTNTDGFVEVSVPKRDDIQVVLSHENFDTIDRTLDLRKDPDQTRTYYMEK